MRINEIINGIKSFVAQIKVTNGSNPILLRTTVTADGMPQAKALLVSLHGQSNVLSISEIHPQIEEEVTAQSPEKQRVKSLIDQSKRLAQQAKELRAQEAMKKAQKALTTVQQSKPLPTA
jgi:hypothetical protein